MKQLSVLQSVSHRVSAVVLDSELDVKLEADVLEDPEVSGQ